MASTTYGTMNDPKGGVAKITCPTFEAMGQIPTFHRTYFLFATIFGKTCRGVTLSTNATIGHQVLLILATSKLSIEEEES